MGDMNPSCKGLFEIRQYYPPVTPTSSTLQCSQTQCPPKHIFVRTVHVKGFEQIFGCEIQDFPKLSNKPSTEISTKAGTKLFP